MKNLIVSALVAMAMAAAAGSASALYDEPILWDWWLDTYDAPPIGCPHFTC